MNVFKLGGGILATLLIGILIFVFLFMTRIPNGYVGVVYSPSGGAQEETLGPGWHVMGLFEKVIKYPVRLQTVEYKDMQVATSDGKNIKMDIAINYSVKADKVVSVYDKFGPVKVDTIEENYLRTRLWDASRKGIAKFSVIDTYGEKSADAAVDVKEIFSKDVDRLGFVVENLTIGVPKPDKKTQEAIDARVQASQELERKETEKQIAIKEAERLKAEAKGQADAEREKAQGTADANKLINDSLTDELIEYNYAKRWNGQMPYVSGGSTLNQLPSELFKQEEKKK